MVLRTEMQPEPKYRFPHYREPTRCLNYVSSAKGVSQRSKSVDEIALAQDGLFREGNNVLLSPERKKWDYVSSARDKFLRKVVKPIEVIDLTQDENDEEIYDDDEMDFIDKENIRYSIPPYLVEEEIYTIDNEQIDSATNHNEKIDSTSNYISNTVSEDDIEYLEEKLNTLTKLDIDISYALEDRNDSSYVMEDHSDDDRDDMTNGSALFLKIQDAKDCLEVLHSNRYIDEKYNNNTATTSASEFTRLFPKFYKLKHFSFDDIPLQYQRFKHSFISKINGNDRINGISKFSFWQGDSQGNLQGSSKKTTKTKKKKSKSSLADPVGKDPGPRSSVTERELARGTNQPEPIDKNANILREDKQVFSQNVDREPKTSTENKSDSRFSIKQALHKKKHTKSKRNPRTSAIEKVKFQTDSRGNGIGNDNITNKNEPLPESSEKSLGNVHSEKSPSDDTNTENLVFDVPLETDRSSLSGDERNSSHEYVISPTKCQTTSSDNIRLDYDTTDSCSEINKRITKPSVILTDTEIGSKTVDDSAGRIEIPGKNEIPGKKEIEVPKKCLWYDYSKDSAVNRVPTTDSVPNTDTEFTLQGTKSAENVSMRIYFDDENDETSLGRIKSAGYRPGVNIGQNSGHSSLTNTDSESKPSQVPPPNVIISTPVNVTDTIRTKLLGDCTDEMESYGSRVRSLEIPVPGQVVSQASVESECSCDSGVEQTETEKQNGKLNVSGIRLVSEDEEERDSGTELRYDDFLSNKRGVNNSDYEKWLTSIKPLLHDAELVANLYLRLANKYGRYCSHDDESLYVHHLHSAQIAYDVIKDGTLTNFSSVISYLLAYIGAIKSEKALPDNISIPSLLRFLEELIKRNTMTSEHVTMLTCFLARPNRKLNQHHELRLSFLQTCFKQEISQLNVNTEEENYLRVCFIKVSEYFIQWNVELSRDIVKQYIIPFLNDHNSTPFVMQALTYMGLVKSERPVVTTSDITSALVLLDIIFRLKKMSLLTSQKLYAFIQLSNPKFRFCETERDALTKTLQNAIGF